MQASLSYHRQPWKGVFIDSATWDTLEWMAGFNLSLASDWFSYLVFSDIFIWNWYEFAF
jgi:hypothetical protein